MISSFDVFDTAIVRIWANPQDLFWELGYVLKERNILAINQDEFMAIRIKSEQLARKEFKNGEVNLQAIYSLIGKSLNLSEEEIIAALEEEIALEVRSSRVVPSIRIQIEQERKANRKVIYLSDMYLPHSVIKVLLEKNFLWENEDELYVSNQMGCSKASGELFKLLLDKKSLVPSMLKHIGDNIQSDVNVPKQIGVLSQHFSLSCLNRYEQLIYNKSHLPLKFRSLITGSSRLARLRSPKLDFRQQVIWDTFVWICLLVLRKSSRKWN
jgi:predicted HAD superfamily hydrolase